MGFNVTAKEAIECSNCCEIVDEGDEISVKETYLDGIVVHYCEYCDNSIYLKNNEDGTVQLD